LRPNTVSLSHALASLGGVDVVLDAPARQIRDAIGAFDHLVLVLADGLGMNLVEQLAPDCFLRRNLAFEMRSVFPSSTAPSLTSLASGLWPAQHGLLGWFVYLPDRGIQAITLPFRERFTGRPLGGLGIGGDELFSWRALLHDYEREARLLMPSSIVESEYTSSVAADVPVDGYRTLTLAVERLAQRLKAEKSPTYTYFYYPKVDSAAHSHGPGSAAVRKEVQGLDRALEELKSRLDGRARIIVSSDHGGIDVDAGGKVLLDPNDRVTSLLKTPPSGEPRAPIFHVKPGASEDFAEAFRSQYGEQFALLTTEEVLELELLGPVAPSAIALERMGDFMGFNAGREALIYSIDQGMIEMAGFHGGLHPDEVRIPLIAG
jgi:hypothetical protein